MCSHSPPVAVYLQISLFKSCSIFLVFQILTFLGTMGQVSFVVLFQGMSPVLVCVMISHAWNELFGKNTRDVNGILQAS